MDCRHGKLQTPFCSNIHRALSGNIHRPLRLRVDHWVPATDRQPVSSSFSRQHCGLPAVNHWLDPKHPLTAL
jgi:hypothetical protein